MWPTSGIRQQGREGWLTLPADTLMLMSDGVAEAQDEKGHLFGFERIHAMLQRPITAAEVATAAQNVGQEDDIRVPRIVRDAMTLRQINAEPVRAVG